MDLPEQLRLPLERGAPFWYWSGGRPALDFVNTLRERWRRRVETLVGDDDLADWLVAAGIVPAVPAIAPGMLQRARDLREAIDAGVVAAVAGHAVPDSSRVVIGRELPLAALPERLLRGADGSLVLVPALPADVAAHGLGLVARDAARMFTAAEIGRVRVCGSETCSGRFFDRSPAAARRWCSSTGCGNVEKARRHRRRQREARLEEPSS